MKKLILILTILCLTLTLSAKSQKQAEKVVAVKKTDTYKVNVPVKKQYTKQKQKVHTKKRYIPREKLDRSKVKPKPYVPVIIQIPKVKPSQSIDDKDWGIKRLSVDKVWKNLTGKNVNIAILDSGIFEHKDLEHSLGYHFNASKSNSYDDEFGHGTMVAGVISGYGNKEYSMIGIAPESKIFSIKIAGKSGLGDSGDIVEALDWIIEYNKQNPEQKISIINISYGLESNIPHIQKAIQKTYESGVLIIASAGNSGNTIVMYPAKYKNVISVSASEINDKFYVNSSFGDKIDFIAPGKNIYTTDNRGNYVWVEGTSFSSAYLTGLSALAVQSYRDVYHKDPSPKEIYTLLKNSAETLNLKSYKQGNGIINATKF